MMEFEEIQKIWDEQKEETMYVINETAVHKSVTQKKNAAIRRIKKVEIMVSIINAIAAIFLFVRALQGNHNWAYFSSGLMAATVIFIQYFRWKRKKTENIFDRTMLGELDHAISSTNYIIKFNYLMIIAYLIPLLFLNVSKMIVEGASLEKWLITTVAIILALFVVRWEQKKCNLPRKNQLLALKKKLME